MTRIIEVATVEQPVSVDRATYVHVDWDTIKGGWRVEVWHDGKCVQRQGRPYKHLSAATTTALTAAAKIEQDSGERVFIIIEEEDGRNG